MSSPSEIVADDKKSAKNFATVWTVIYLMLFPFFLLMTLMSAMIFDSPSMTVPIGLGYMFMISWIPVSMAISIYLMWSNYCKGRYKKTRVFWIVPFLTIGVVIILNGILQSLFL